MDKRPGIRELQNEVQTGKWEALGLQLDLNHKKLEDIKTQNHQNVAACRTHMFLLWLDTFPDASRRQLLNALSCKAVSEMFLAQQYEKYIEKLEARGLQKMNVWNSRPDLAELENHVRTYKWHALGIQLGLYNDELEGFKSEYRGDIAACRQMMFALWLKQTEPTRQKLLDALRTRAVAKIRIADQYELYICQQLETPDIPGGPVFGVYSSSQPHEILKAYSSKILDAVTEPDRLANDLSSADLISCHVADSVLNTPGLSRYDKTSRLLEDFQRLVKVSNDIQKLFSFCTILNKQDNPVLKLIADEVLTYVQDITFLEEKKLNYDVRLNQLEKEVYLIKEELKKLIKANEQKEDTIEDDQTKHHMTRHDQTIELHKQSKGHLQELRLKDDPAISYDEAKRQSQRFYDMRLDDLEREIENLTLQSIAQMREMDTKIKYCAQDSSYFRSCMNKSSQELGQCKTVIDELRKKQNEAHEQLKAEVYSIKEKLEKLTKADELKEDAVVSVESGHTKEANNHMTINAQAITLNTQSTEYLRLKGDPGVSLHNMELIAEYHTKFSSDEPYFLNWDKYGCRLHIPQGSIPQGEVGTLDLYAIYSGPFKFPKNASPVSAFYFISLSHILQKPATLALQHCYIINNDDDAAHLTFVSATTSTGPPYHFRPVDGGSFLPGRYALIHQTKFSFFGILETLEWIRQSISRLVFGCSYAVLSFLIPIESPVLWNVKLFITKYTNAHYEYQKQKQEQESSEKPVHEDFQPFVLKEGIDTISISVLPEEDGNEHQQVKLKPWKGTRQVFGTNWEVIGSVTQVYISSVLENLSPCIPIHIEWTSEDPPERCVFRIHLLGVAKEVSIPVIVPYRCQKRQSGSLIPSREQKMEEKDLISATDQVLDWFTLGIYLKVDYKVLKTIEKNHSSDLNRCRQEMLISWISSGNATWSILVKTLRDDMKEVAIAEKIKEMYIH